MAEEQKTENKNTPKPVAPIARPEGIAIAKLIFGHDLSAVPGHRGPASSLIGYVAGGAAPNGAAQYEIEFVPQLRHHRIIERKTGVVRMIHESHVEQWEPASSVKSAVTA